MSLPANHRYALPGEDTLEGCVTDTNGGVGYDTFSVIVTGDPITATATATSTATSTMIATPTSTATATEVPPTPTATSTATQVPVGARLFLPLTIR